MKKMECPSCAMEIDANSEVCPICSYEFPRQNKGMQWIAVLLVIVMLLLIFIW